jgi:hypothetical protein
MRVLKAAVRRSEHDPLKERRRGARRFCVATILRRGHGLAPRAKQPGQEERAIRHLDGSVELDVVDTGSGRPGGPGSGPGLVGMREDLRSNVLGVSLASWARNQADRLLCPLGNRWLHVQQAAEQARRVATVVPPDDRDLLVAAAYLHDVGYAPTLAQTGFHPLDGARWLRDARAEPRLARLVAHHSCAIHEARIRGLAGPLLEEFEPEASATYDALVFCDMTAGPAGEIVSLRRRLGEIVQRYGPDHEVSRALESSRPCLTLCHARTLARLHVLALADVGPRPVLQVVPDTEPDRWVHLVAGNLAGGNELDL